MTVGPKSKQAHRPGGAIWNTVPAPARVKEMGDKMSKLPVDEIIEMYTSEPPMTVAQICAELNVHSPQVYEALRRGGIEPDRAIKGVRASGRQRAPVAYGDLSDEEVQRIVAEYMLHEKTAREISREVGKSYTHVLKILSNARVQIVPGRRSRSERSLRRKIMDEMTRNSDLNLSELALKYGVSLDYIARVGRKLLDFRTRFPASKWGKTEAIVEEVLARIEDRGVGQLRLPGL